MRLRFVALWMLLIPVVGGCQALAVAPGEQVNRTFSTHIVKTVGYDYLLYLPPEYGKQQDQRWPLVLFLHGAGERGKDLNLVKFHGPTKLVAQGRRFPFILVSPQCPAEETWDAEALNALLDDIVARYAVDQDRIYVTGLSNGRLWHMGSGDALSPAIRRHRPGLRERYSVDRPHASGEDADVGLSRREG